MEVDTGAIVSLISHETKEELFPEAKVVPSKVVLQTYTREQMEVLGVMKVHVKYGSYDGMLEQFVVEGQEPALMGHDWLQVTQLDRQGVHEAHITGGATAEVQSAIWFRSGSHEGFDSDTHCSTICQASFFVPDQYCMP